MSLRALKAAVPACFMWAAACTADARTLYSDDGISELSVPEHWEVSPHLSQTAVLRATDPRNEAYLVVNSYLPDEINPRPLAKQAEDLSRAMLEGLENAQISPPWKLTIQDRPAIEYEITGRLGDIRLSYLSTVVEGRTAIHHLIAWPLAEGSQADREAQRELVASFRESTKQRQVRERIDLDFNWPRKADAKFDYYSKKTRRGKTSEIRMSGTTRIRALGENQLLVSTRVADYKMAGDDKARNNGLQNVMQQALSGIPDYVVSDDGAFVGIENVDNYLGRLEQGLLKALPGDAGEMQQKVKKLLRSLVSEATLTQSIEDEWNNQVSNWAGGSYAVRERYAYAAQYQSVALGKAVFPMTITQRLLGRVPCRGGEKAKNCVLLEQVSKVADPAFSKAMHAFVSKTVKSFAGDKASEVNVAVERAEFVKTVALVTDPKTLLPYAINTSKVTTVVINDQGRTETTQDMEESSTRYAY